MKTPDEINDMISRLEINIHERGWDASVDAASCALRWVLGEEWANIDAYMQRPDAARRTEWIARGGDPKDWPDTP